MSSVEPTEVMPSTTVETAPASPDLATRRPWRRFLARLLDFWLLMYPTGFAVGVLAALSSVEATMWLQRPHANYLLTLLLAPVVMLLEAGLFRLMGTTPGKWLFGIALTSPSGEALTAMQYLKRQTKVYLYGICAWLPLLNLFTLTYQHGKVKAGLPASYDEGCVDVRARDVGWLKATVSGLAITTLLGLNLYFKHQVEEDGRLYKYGGTWVNPATQKETALPPGWSHQSGQSKDKQPYDVFLNPDEGLMAVFAKENIEARFSVDDYASVWIRVVNPDMHLYASSEVDTIHGEPALVVLGTMADDKTRKIRVNLQRRHDAIWRFVMVTSSSRSAPDSPAAMALREALFASVD
ncbi:MAG TPA: RDD family protein [Aquabacterium sp.]|uniref:RDD family protein n=1 Tax=Aquabacterium sp. TaxID=1872578 RepID=UPI002E33B26C|nr:RDD family protein [Aquabacterium sp.]HEX5356141.1 RDD family protein [Aquabacterium sp.]